MHGKGLQYQTGFCPTVRSQERRAAAGTVINQESTARQPNIVFHIRGHALHEKGLQGQIRRRYIGQLPGTKSGRGPADKPRVLLLHRFTSGFLCSCFQGHVQEGCIRSSGEEEGRLFPGQTDPSAARPRPAPPSAMRRPVPTRPWYVRVLNSTSTKWFT